MATSKDSKSIIWKETFLNFTTMFCLVSAGITDWLFGTPIIVGALYIAAAVSAAQVQLGKFFIFLSLIAIGSSFANKEISTYMIVEEITLAVLTVGVWYFLSQLKTQVVQLSDRERWLIESVDKAPVVFWVISAKDFSLMYISPAYETVWKRTRESLFKDPLEWSRAVHPDDQERTEKSFFKMLENGEYDEIYRIRQPDGSIRWIHDRGSPIYDSAGKPVRLVGLAEDITLRREHEETSQRYAEELKEAKATAEEANRAKSDFLARMSHEIRTPMNGVLGMLRLLKNSSLQAKQSRQVDIAVRSAESLIKLINDILDFSKIEAGKMGLDRASFSLSKLVEEVIETLFQEARSKGLNLLCFIDPSLQATFYGDSHKLRRVIVNLIHNAIKYTHQGSVSIKVSRDAQFKLTEDGYENILFEVSDTGIGIPKDEIDSLFDAFTQVEALTPEKLSGTGLGLAICKHLVNLLDGEISASSKPGQGSTFKFNIKIQRDSEQVDRPAKTQYQQLINLPIAILSDDLQQGKFLTELVDAWKMKPVPLLHQPGTQEFIDETDQVKFILVDMDNKDTLNSASAFKHKTIGITAFDKESEPEFKYTVRKPIFPSELFDTIISALNGEETTHEVVMIDPIIPADKKPVNKHILVAEDNEVNQIVVGDILQSVGYSYEIVDNGKAAVESYGRGTCDAILMDMRMPVMDGMEAIQRIREHEEKTEAHVPIIMLTANAFESDKEACIKIGADAFMSKPVDPKDLLDTIEELTQGEDTSCPVMISNLLQRCMGQVSTASQVLEVFQKNSKTTLIELDQAISAQDSAQSSRLAHSLKGSASTVSAERLAELASTLEEVKNTNDFEFARNVLEAMNEEFENCVSFLDSQEIESYC